MRTIESSRNNIVLSPCLLRFALIIMFFCSGCVSSIAQDDTGEEEFEENVNRIKMSNQYFVAEAIDETVPRAAKKCYKKLFLDVHKYREQKKMAPLDTLTLTKAVTLKTISVGNMKRVFAYMERATAEQKGKIKHDDVFSVEEQSTVQVVSAGKQRVQLEMPEVIRRVSRAESFTMADMVLSNAKSTGRISEYTKYRLMDDPDACYLLILDKEMKVVTVLTPKEEKGRQDVHTGEIVDLSHYSGYAAICIKI